VCAFIFKQDIDFKKITQDVIYVPNVSLIQNVQLNGLYRNNKGMQPSPQSV